MAAVYRGQIYRSTDNGSSWTLVNPKVPGHVISNLVRSPSSGSLFIGSWAAVLRSDDQGKNWVNIGVPCECEVRVVAIKPDGTIFANGSPGEIYRSTDNGETWSALRDGFPSVDITSLAADSIGRVYAAFYGPGELYRSSDNGQSWVQLSGLTDIVWALGFDPHGHIFAFAAVPAEGRIFRYEDDANTWQVVTSLPSVWQACFAFGPDNTVFVGTYGLSSPQGIYRSQDDGRTWSYLGPHMFSIRSLTVTSLGHVFAGTEGAGVYRSIDGGDNWAPVTQGMTAAEIQSLLLTANGQLLAAARNGGIHRSDDGGQTWALLNPGLFFMSWPLWPGPISPVLSMTSAGVIYYAWGGQWWEAGSGVARSRDNGSTWEENIGPPFYGPTMCVAVDNRDYLYVAIGGPGRGVYRSINGGDSWQHLGLQEYDIYSIAVTPAGTILASSFAYSNPELGGVFRSTDNGQTWTRVGFDGHRWVGFISVSPNGHIFLESQETGVHRSTDDGQTWANVHPHRVSPIGINSEGRVYTAGTQILYSSADDGGTWTEEYSDPSFLVYFWSFAFDSEGYLYGGSSGEGVWRSTQTTFLVKTVAIDIKPGTYPNTINLGSGGTVPVAILSSETFDATTVDPLTVTLAGANVRLKGKGTPMSSFEDFNADGRLDLLVHVETEALDLSSTSEEAVLEGSTYSGRRIKGMDTVKIVPAS